jgi:hypothetical protein
MEHINLPSWMAPFREFRCAGFRIVPGFARPHTTILVTRISDCDDLITTVAQDAADAENTPEPDEHSLIEDGQDFNPPGV